MKNVRPFWGMIILIFLFQSCSPVIITYNRQVDFSKYHSFKFLKPDIKHEKNPLYNNTLFQEEIKQDITFDLQSYGMELVKDNPDVFVKFSTFVEKHTEKIATSVGPQYGGYGYGRGRGGYYGRGSYGRGGFGGGARVGVRRVQTIQYSEGNLIVDFYDGKNKESLLWRGSIKGDITDLNQIQSEIKKGVGMILKKYPHQKK